MARYETLESDQDVIISTKRRGQRQRQRALVLIVVALGLAVIVTGAAVLADRSKRPKKHQNSIYMHGAVAADVGLCSDAGG